MTGTKEDEAAPEFTPGQLLAHEARPKYPTSETHGPLGSPERTRAMDLYERFESERQRLLDAIVLARVLARSRIPLDARVLWKEDGPPRHENCVVIGAGIANHNVVPGPFNRTAPILEGAASWSADHPVVKEWRDVLQKQIDEARDSLTVWSDDERTVNYAASLARAEDVARVLRLLADDERARRTRLLQERE